MDTEYNKDLDRRVMHDSACPIETRMCLYPDLGGAVVYGANGYQPENWGKP